jgi:ABC-type tungstate transport system substrate-binding protein
VVLLAALVGAIAWQWEMVTFDPVIPFAIPATLAWISIACSVLVDTRRLRFIVVASTSSIGTIAVGHQLLYALMDHAPSTETWGALFAFAGNAIGFSSLVLSIAIIVWLCRKWTTLPLGEGR